MRLSIMLPGLIWPEQINLDYIYQNIKLPHFNHLIKKSNALVHNYSFSDLIYQLNLSQMKNDINLTATDSLASIYAKYLGIDNIYASYLIIEPTHLRLNNVDLQICSPELLQLDVIEAKKFIAEINNFYASELKIYFLNNNLWLLGHNLELESEINYYPILDIVGENVNDYLPTGIGSIQLNKIVNEIQMFLFNSQLNHTRQKNNHLSLNSIWIWNKKINPNTYTNYANVFSNHATLTIEKYSNSIHPLPTNQEDLIQNNSLVIIDNLFYSSCYRDNYTYSQQLEQLDQTLGKFLQQKIADKHIQELNILIPVGKNTIQLRTIQLHKYKFWRNNSLIHFIKEYHAR